MFFTSNVKLNVVKGPPSLSLRLVSSLQCLVVSSPFSAIIAFTAAFVDSMTAQVITCLTASISLAILLYLLVLLFAACPFMNWSSESACDDTALFLACFTKTGYFESSPI